MNLGRDTIQSITHHEREGSVNSSCGLVLKHLMDGAASKAVDAGRRGSEMNSWPRWGRREGV